MKRRLLAAIVALWVLAVEGCIMECPSIPSDPIEDKEVFGIYCANFGDADRDCIILLEDSACVHFYSDTQASHIDSASWSFDRHPGHDYVVALRNFTIYHPRLSIEYVRIPAGRFDKTLINLPHDQCYESAPEGIVDTTSLSLAMKLDKRGKRIQLEYCWKKFENYIKVDSATAEEIREEMLQCLTGE